MTVDFQMLELAALRAWPGLSDEIREGWRIRFADGYTKRANSVTPLAQADTDDLPKTIEDIRAIYGAASQPFVVRISSLAPPEIDAFLDRDGFSKIDLSLVMALDVSNRNFTPISAVIVEDQVTTKWLEAVEDFGGAARSFHPVLSRMVSEDKGLNRAFLRLRDADRDIGCALCVSDGTHAGVFEVAVDPDQRGRGHGRVLMETALAWVKAQNIATAYLQVVADNGPAVGLYQRLGFSHCYEYHYRTKGKNPQ